MSTSKVIVKHTYNATPEKLFKLWTTPEGMLKFFDGACTDAKEVQARDPKIDLKVGGKFSVTMGPKKFHHEGVYKEVNPYSKISFTWNSHVVTNTLVTVEFNPKGEKTECVLTHELLPPDMVEGHTGGWNNIFNNLNSVV